MASKKLDEIVIPENLKKMIMDTNPGVLASYLLAPRLEWAYEDYITAAQDAVNLKHYAQWVIGGLAHEVYNKFGVTQEFADALKLTVGTIYQYRMTYKKIITSDPNFEFDGFFPWTVLHIASTYSKNPAEDLEELRDKGISSIKGAYRHIKGKVTGNDAPPKPRVSLRYNPETNKYNLMIPSTDLILIDWTTFKNEMKEFLDAL